MSHVDLKKSTSCHVPYFSSHVNKAYVYVTCRFKETPCLCVKFDGKGPHVGRKEMLQTAYMGPSHRKRRCSYLVGSTAVCGFSVIWVYRYKGRGAVSGIGNAI